MNKNIFPLSERLRPKSLAEFYGQEHITGQGKIISSLIMNKRINSMILWGPPGTGKTTLSRIIVNELNYPALEFSATISKISEVRDIMKRAQQVKKLEKKPLVLFVDEIHHFNKHSQDAFLPYVERRDIVLLGTTIENPAYKINRALLSRMKIVELYPLEEELLVKIFLHAEKVLAEEADFIKPFTSNALNLLVNYSNGDVRKMLNLLELVVNTADNKTEIEEKFLREIMQKNVGSYDRTGDDRYQLISALHKSIRNSDVDASLFWLYRMLEGGEDPLFIIRRLIRVAVEDVGFADRDALKVCLETKGAYEFLGSPEGDLFLAQATIYLACAPKSNSLYLTEKKLKKLMDKYRNTDVLLHIINPSNFLARRKGAGDGYMYAHNYPQKTTLMQTLPPQVKEKDFFVPGNMGFEKKIKQRIEYWKKIKEQLKSPKK